MRSQVLSTSARMRGKEHRRVSLALQVSAASLPERLNHQRIRPAVGSSRMMTGARPIKALDDPDLALHPMRLVTGGAGRSTAHVEPLEQVSEMTVRDRTAVERAGSQDVPASSQGRSAALPEIADQLARREARPVAIDSRIAAVPARVARDPAATGSWWSFLRHSRRESQVSRARPGREILDRDDRSVVARETVGADGRSDHRTPFARASSRSAAKTTSLAGLAVPSPVMTISPGSEGTANTSGCTVPTIERVSNRYDML